MDSICQKHSNMIGPAVCLHCEIESLRRRLQDGSPVVEGTIQHMAMEIAGLKKERDGLKATAAGLGLVKAFEKMGRDQFISKAVDRFLGWRLPKDFYPDCGISFKPPEKPHPDVLYEYWPVGTNLFTADQAKAMFEHCIQEREVIMPRVEEQLAFCQQRISELESVIKSHGIPVKTMTGGVAHYCTGIYDAKEQIRATCNPHPDAPHGFDRNSSHSEDRYVCECEFWEEPKMTNPTPVAWVLINSDGECEQIDYCQESPLPDDDGFKPLFTLDQLNQARADALREAAEFVMNQPKGKIIGTKLRAMADEIEGGKNGSAD